MPNFTPVFLTIHVLTAIAAFGPNFALPLVARMAAQEPQHGLFALRATNAIQRRIVIPAALTMPVSGGLLVWSEGIDVSSTHWLLLAIGLYVITVSFAVGIQLRTIGRMIQIASGMVAAGPALAAGPGAELARPVEVPGSRAKSPASELAGLGIRARNGGFFLLLMIVIIVSLMAGKPTI